MRKDLYQQLRSLLIVLTCTLLVLAIAFAALSEATGSWPPMMAVESRSMQHNNTTSSVGTIDTGDAVVVDHKAEQSGIRTYIDSVADGYKSFGDYGDVIVYQPPSEDVPIVHRAICWLIYDGHGGFDVPDLSKLPQDRWGVPGEAKRWNGLSNTLELYQVGYANVTVRIDLAGMLQSMVASPYSGLVTMGDNNWNSVGPVRLGVVDQGGIPGIEGPIKQDWIIGKATAEVPWFGTIRLWLTGTAPSYLPLNSVVDLAVSIAILIFLPVIIYGLGHEMLVSRRARRLRR